MAKREANEADLKAANRLKLAVESCKQKNPEMTQLEIASRIGMTQGAVGHYVNGRTPLNLDALFAICGVIEANPAKIYPELVSTKMFGDSDALSEFISAYTMLDVKNRAHFLELMKSSVCDSS